MHTMINHQGLTLDLPVQPPKPVPPGCVSRDILVSLGCGPAGRALYTTVNYNSISESWYLNEGDADRVIDRGQNHDGSPRAATGTLSVSGELANEYLDALLAGKPANKSLMRLV